MTRSPISAFVLFVLCSYAFASTNPNIKLSSRKAQRPVPACTGAELTVRSDPNFEDSAMGGQRGASYIVKNTSSKPCTITGQPGIVLFDKRSHMMGSRIAPNAEGGTTIKAHGQVSFEVGYHSCFYAMKAGGKSTKKCRSSSTAQIRFHGISRTFTVHDALDADGGIEQVEGWEEK